MSNELSSSWAFWYSSLENLSKSQTSNNQYEKELLLLYEVRTVQQFFNSYSYLSKLSEIQRNDSLSFFRIGRKPMWEACPSGGCWIIKIQRNEGDRADLYWETLLIECIRGGFSKDIDGIMALGKHREIILQIWMHEAHATHTIIAKEIKDCLNLPSLKMYLKYHKDSIADLSGIKNSVLVNC